MIVISIIDVTPIHFELQRSDQVRVNSLRAGRNRDNRSLQQPPLMRRLTIAQPGHPADASTAPTLEATTENTAANPVFETLPSTQRTPPPSRQFRLRWQ